MVRLPVNCFASCRISRKSCLLSLLCTQFLSLWFITVTRELHGDEIPTVLLTELKRYDAPEAFQAVAVDHDHFYAIANSTIGKYRRNDGQKITFWKADKQHPLTHLNSGVVRDGKLYCAHSNYPHVPESSSVEIWDADTLKHLGNHSFGIYEGSLTWIDWHDDSWWAVFAHYSKPQKDNPHQKDHRWTSLVRFDSQWRRQAGWVFPKELLDRFAPSSCSGGYWGPDGRLYCTGHDLGELYQVELPKAGSTLMLTAIYKLPITGQGVAWDAHNREVWGIDRPQRQVVVSSWITPAGPAEPSPKQ